MALAQRKVNSSEPLRPLLGQRLKPIGGGSARRALSSLGSSNRRANLRLAESLLTISASEFCSKWNFDPLTETPLPQGQFLWTPVKPKVVSLVPVKLAGAARPKTKAEGDLVACFNLPQKEVVTRLNGENYSCKVSENCVKPLSQTCNANVQPVGQKCKELRCLSVKSNACSEINKSRNINFKRPLCTDEENNNLITPASISNNQRQSTMIEFLRASKQPMPSSSVSCEAPTGTSPRSAITGTIILPPSKLQRIVSDGDTL